MKVVALSLLIVSTLSIAAERPCPAIGASDISKLATYVQKKYRLQDVEVKELGFVEESCYRRLRFSTEARSIDLVASPDLRFLTRELLDSRIDPIEEEEQRARVIAAKLASPGSASMGSKDAPITMVLFSDFQCPFCSRMATGLMTEIMPADGDKIRLIFRNFPLPMHPWARAAAEATSCAATQDDKYFWELHDYIFGHQRELTAENIVEKLLAVTDLDVVRFKACVDGHDTAAQVDRDIAFGKEMRVAGTPTLFINGQRVPGFHAEQIKTLIRELSELAR